MLIAVVSLLPFPSPAVERVAFLDKAFHLCEYLLFAWCFIRASLLSGWSRARASTVAFLVSAGLGVVLEGLQGLVPYRTAEFWDVVANLVGTMGGLACGLKSVRS